MANVWSYHFSVTEHFLKRKHYDRVYEPGESRQISVHFFQDADDDACALRHLHSYAEQNGTAFTSVELLAKRDNILVNRPQKPIKVFNEGGKLVDPE